MEHPNTAPASLKTPPPTTSTEPSLVPTEPPSASSPSILPTTPTAPTAPTAPPHPPHLSTGGLEPTLANLNALEQELHGLKEAMKETEYELGLSRQMLYDRDLIKCVKIIRDLQVENAALTRRLQAAEEEVWDGRYVGLGNEEHRGC